MQLETRILFPLFGFLPLSSRPERQEDSRPLAHLWRGVEGSRQSVLCHTATRHSPQNVNFNSLGEGKPLYRSGGVGLALLQPIDRPKSNGERDDAGKNSLRQCGKGQCMGIPPLRARDFRGNKISSGAAVGMTSVKCLRGPESRVLGWFPSAATMKTV
jgi:hypothetical protein